MKTILTIPHRLARAFRAAVRFFLFPGWMR